jgi:hypothetical protein
MNEWQSIMEVVFFFSFVYGYDSISLSWFLIPSINIHKYIWSVHLKTPSEFFFISSNPTGKLWQGPYNLFISKSFILPIRERNYCREMKGHMPFFQHSSVEIGFMMVWYRGAFIKPPNIPNHQLINEPISFVSQPKTKRWQKKSMRLTNERRKSLPFLWWIFSQFRFTRVIIMFLYKKLCRGLMRNCLVTFEIRNWISSKMEELYANQYWID